MSFIDKLWVAIDPILPGLVAAGLFIVLIAVARLKLRGDSLAERLKNPVRLFYVYLLLFFFAVLAKIYWKAIYRFVFLFSLFVLALAVVLAFSVAMFDIFLGRYRKVSVPAILRDIIVIFVYSVMVIVIMGQAGVNITSIITTSAVLTAVIGFALQDLLSSLLSGLAIQIEKPFTVGHWVQFDEQVGVIKEINWRSTKIKTFHQDIVIIPNNLITRSAVINFSVPTRVHRRKLTIGMRYEAPPNRVRASIMKALSGVEGVMSFPAPFIGLQSYDDFSIQYKIFFFIQDFSKKEIIESEVRTRLWYQLKRDRLSIPFPIRDVNVRNVPLDEHEIFEEKKRREIRAALSTVPFLDPLSEEELETLACGVKSEFYAQGERVIEQGEGGSSFYIVASGEVDVLVPSKKGGPPAKVAELSKHDFFGEQSLMTGEKRSATVVTTTDSEFFVIDKPTFKKIISENKDLVQSIGRCLAERQKELESQKDDLSGKEMGESVEDPRSIMSKIRRFFQI